MPRGGRRTGACALALATLAPVAAVGLEHQGRGFAVTPPAPYRAEPVANRRQFDIGVGVIAESGRPTPAGTSKYACEVGFKFAEANAKLTPAQINALIEKPEWINVMRAAIEMGFHVNAQALFTLQGFRGIEFQTTPKQGPQAPDVRVTLSVVETAKGRMTAICGTTKDEFDAALKDFRAIRESVARPR